VVDEESIKWLVVFHCWDQCFDFLPVLRHNCLTDRRGVQPLKPVRLITKCSLPEEMLETNRGEPASQIFTWKTDDKMEMLLFAADVNSRPEPRLPVNNSQAFVSVIRTRLNSHSLGICHSHFSTSLLHYFRFLRLLV